MAAWCKMCLATGQDYGCRCGNCRYLSSVDYYEKPENVLDVMRNAFAVSEIMADLIIAMNLSDLASEITLSASTNYFQ